MMSKILYGDGVHDDTEALKALFAGEDETGECALIGCDCQVFKFKESST
jgi:hypothetical protein